MDEKTVEKKLKIEVEKLGGLCLKFVSPGNRGVPDRIVILPPNGRVVFVELKAPQSGVISPLQKRQKAKIEAVGSRVKYIKNYSEILAFLAEVKNGI